MSSLIGYPISKGYLYQYLSIEIGGHEIERHWRGYMGSVVGGRRNGMIIFCLIKREMGNGELLLFPTHSM